MNPKLLILKLLLNRELYNQYRQFISLDTDKHLETIYKALDDLFSKVDREITLNELEAYLEASGATTREKDRVIYEQYFNLLNEAQVGEDILLELLKKIKTQEIAERLGSASYDFASGTGSFDSIVSLFNAFEGVDTPTSTVEFVTDDLEELYEQTIHKPGLRWRLRSLNRILGSLRPGDFGFIFARPETGKTTFLASEVTNFAEQVDKPILWFNNEEQGNKVMIRCYEAALGLPLHELTKDRKESQRRYYELTKRNLRIFDDAALSRKTIESICRANPPSLVVIDQLDKLKGFDGDREDLRLGAIYQWARELAKTYCPVIAVCQADGSGEGVKWLNMSHVANAKTSKQAEADFIIGIGKTTEQGREKARFINISKNKLQGDEDSDPTQRHGFIEVVIEPELARYRDIGE